MAPDDPLLPAQLAPLRELALDLEWTWSHHLDALWRRVNPALWDATRNPWLVLQSAGRSELDVLASDGEFVDAASAFARERHRVRAAPAWYQRTHRDAALHAVAYFSMEYGISEALPMYAGGLGVLAGDYLKAASNLGVPVTAVGLLYQFGYFRQAIDPNGEQLEFYPSNDPGDMPLLPARDRDGAVLNISLAFPGRSVHVRAWRAQVGRVALYLLDTNDPQNAPVDRGITSELYGGGPELRLQQELILGIGGWRILEALDVRPTICHLNEGHAAFAVLERAHALMQRESVPFDVAVAATRPGNIFTTHTPVAAGFDRFDRALCERYLRGYAAELGVPAETLLALGRAPDDASFMPAYLAMRTSGAVNAVSRKHEETSRALFAPLFPRWPLAGVPVGHVTNGVHAPSWDSPDSDRLWTEICGKDRWRDDLTGLEERIARSDASDVWGMRLLNRERLVTFVRDRLERQLRRSGADEGRIEAARHGFDAGTLTIGIARRFASYKRPVLLLEDEQRLIGILTHAQRPVQIVIAGKAHPDDAQGKEMVRRWASFAQRAEVQGRVAFLEDYDLMMAEQLVSGADLWLNTPLAPWEASGTSGMKVLVNGGINCSSLDGWWVEAYSPDAGWAIASPGDDSDAAAARVLYDLLEREVVPAFYARDAEGLPAAWIQRMRASMALAPRFSTNRMTREYVENYYEPGARLLEERTANHCEIGARIVAWERALRDCWPRIHFGEQHVETGGGRISYQVSCYLDDLDPQYVAVELYADAPVERRSMQQISRASDNTALYRVEFDTQRPIGDYTPRIIPSMHGASVPLETAAITWLR